MVIHSWSDEVISRLPREWHDFFKNLNQSVENGTQWFINETSSEYGCKPDWHSLIPAIVRDEPCIEEDKLVFKPRFLLLPSRMQNYFLEFLKQQVCILPDIYIQDFVLAVIQHTDRQSKLYQQLLQLAEKSNNYCDWMKKLSCIDNVSQNNTARLNEEHEVRNVKQVSESSHTGSPECIIIDTSDSDTCQEPEPKRRKLEISEEIGPDHEVIMDDVSEDGKGDQHDNVQPTEINDDKDNDNVGKDSELGSIELLVLRLKEVWLNCVRECEVEELKDVAKLSIKDIEAFCRLIDFDSMSDDSLELVCEHLCDLSDTLSYDGAVAFLRHVLGSRIMHLSQNASRKLSGAVTLVCQKYSKHIVDSVIIPCMGNEDLNSAQSEILCKILKEGLNTQTRGYFVYKIVQKSIILTELKIAVLQLVIDSGCEMTTDTLISLMKYFESVAVTMAKNLKFGKLLFAIVNKQGKIFSLGLKTSVESILDKHETFLKKSIQNALNKLKL